MTDTEITALCSKFDGKIVNDYPNYIICKNGEIYSLARKKFLDKTNRKRNPLDINSKCDAFVHLVVGGSSVSVPVYRLLAKAFVPNPENKTTVNHIDGNPSNIDISNLEWLTQSENSKHAHDNNLVGGKYTKCTKSVIVYKEELVGIYSNVSVAIKTLNLKCAKNNINKTAAINTEIGTGIGKIPFTNQGLVWRYSKESEIKYTAEPVTFTEQDINKIKHVSVVGHNDYVVTIDGRMYNTSTDKWLTTTLVTPKDGEKFASCSVRLDDGSYRSVRLAKVVAAAFCSDWRNVTHKDGNVLNCHADNLIELNSSHTARQIEAYKLLWKEEVIEEYESVDMMCTNEMSKCATLDVIIKNRNIAIQNEFTTGRTPYTYKTYVLRGWK